MARREFKGGAAQLVLSSGIAGSGVTSISTTGTATGWPTGATGKFLVVIDKGTASEEKLYCTSRTGNTLAVASDADRGADGTVGVSHSSGATVNHVGGAVDLDEANKHVADTTQDDHTQYLKVDGTRATTGVTAIAGTPGSSAVGDVAAKGAGPLLATSNHVHGREAFATPVAVGTANAAGSAATVVHSDHVHLAPGNIGKTLHTADYTLTTGYTDVMSVTVTLVAGRQYRVSAACHGSLSAASYFITAKLVDGSTQIATTNMETSAFTSRTQHLELSQLVTGTGSKTYKVQALTGPSTGGTGVIADATAGGGYILVEDIGT
jgi:hypothetical protein